MPNKITFPSLENTILKVFSNVKLECLKLVFYRPWGSSFVED
jgi:hypothetical protein